MNKKNLNLILLLLTYFATQHDVINAMKRPHTQISNTQQNKQLPPTLKKTKLNNKTAAFLCALCNKSFSHNDTLQRHMDTHTGEKPYSCDICHKSFITSGHLIIHQKAHAREKPYSCDICHKSFITSGHLIIHQRTHTGEKPYLCDICNKSFTTNGNLTVHIRTHTGEKPYSCNVCNKNFAHKSALTKHEKIHTATITLTINCAKNNIEQIPTLITNNIVPKSLNTLADHQSILDNIAPITDTEFNDWIGK